MNHLGFPRPFDRAEILKVLDNASGALTFPILDNGYVYLAATKFQSLGAS